MCECAHAHACSPRRLHVWCTCYIWQSSKTNTCISQTHQPLPAWCGTVRSQMRRLCHPCQLCQPRQFHLAAPTSLSSPVQPCPALSSPVQSLQLVRWKANKVRQTVHQPHQSANHPFPGDLGDRNGNGSPDPHTPHIVLVRCWYSCCGLLLGAGRGGKPEAPPVRRQSMFSQTTSARAHGARTALPACPHLPARQIRICEHAPRPESGLRVA